MFCAKTLSKVEAIRISVIGYLIFYQESRVKHGAIDRSAVKVLICVCMFLFFNMETKIKMNQRLAP